MSNPFLNIINAEMKTLFNNAIDALLANDALTLPCQLIFENTQTTECPNCYFDPISNRSNSQYKTNGPMPFSQGTCPYCHGIGTLATDKTVIIYPVVLWNYKEWIGWNNIPDNTMVPFGYVQTLSKLDTLTNIKAAKEILIDTDLQQYVKHRFMRIIEPNPIGFGSDNYVITIWKRID